MLQYEKGMIYYQPLLDSERALVQQQDALAESRGLVGVNLVAVYKALGGGWRARCCEPQRASPEPIPAGGESQTPLPPAYNPRELPAAEPPPPTPPQPIKTE